MMQPPRSTVILQPQPRSGVSWFMPKLCPSSCAKVTAAPSGFSEWSCDGGGGEGNMLILCYLVHLKCETQSYLNKQLWVKTKPYWSHSPKNGGEKRKESSKKTISNSADSQNSSVAVRSAPSSLFHYSFSLWKHELICHSITPADPIIPAASGDSYCGKLHIPTAVWLAATLISATSARHKGDRDRMKRGKWKFQLHLKFVDRLRRRLAWWGRQTGGVWRVTKKWTQ